MTVRLSVFLGLLGSTGVKAARKMLMKLTPDQCFRLSLGLSTVDCSPTSKSLLLDCVDKDQSNPCFGVEQSLRSQIHQT